MADPIEIKVVGQDDSGPALSAAEKGVKSLGDAAKAAERPLKDSSESLEKVGKAAKGSEGDLRKVGDASEKAGAGLREMGADAKKAEADLDGAGDSVRRLDKFVGDGGRAFGEYGTGIGGVGDRFDELDTRAMGAADGFAGLTDAMKWNKLTAQEQAMVFSDMGSSMYNFIIPQVQSLGKGLSNLTDKMGGVKNVARGAAGLAGIAAVTAGLMALDSQMKQETLKNLDELSTKFQGMSYSSTPANEGLIRVMASLGKLDELWENAKAQGDEQAEQFLDLAEGAGISSDKIGDYREELGNKQAAEEAGVTATERMTEAMSAEAEAIRGVNDARRAAVDPLFGMLDAMNQNRDAQSDVTEAQRAYIEAVHEHGEGSVEAAEALRTLNDAQDDAVISAADLETAASDFEAQIREHPASLANAKGALERWVAQGSITEEQARRMAVRFENAADRADDIKGARKATLLADDRASGKIISAGNRLRDLDGNTATITLRAFMDIIGRNIPGASFLGIQQGGVVPQYMAQGGISRGVGARGTDTVPAMLTPGEMVLSAGHQNRLWEMLNGGGGGGGGRMEIDITGGDDMFIRWLRNRIRDGGGNVQAYLGQ